MQRIEIAGLAMIAALGSACAAGWEVKTNIPGGAKGVGTTATYVGTNGVAVQVACFTNGLGSEVTIITPFLYHRDIEYPQGPMRFLSDQDSMIVGSAKLGESATGMLAFKVKQTLNQSFNLAYEMSTTQEYSAFTLPSLDGEIRTEIEGIKAAGIALKSCVDVDSGISAPAN